MALEWKIDGEGSAIEWEKREEAREGAREKGKGKNGRSKPVEPRTLSSKPNITPGCWVERVKGLDEYTLLLIDLGRAR